MTRIFQWRSRMGGPLLDITYETELPRKFRICLAETGVRYPVRYPVWADIWVAVQQHMNRRVPKMAAEFDTRFWRDSLAKEVMKIMLEKKVGKSGFSASQIALDAYNIADEMLRAREGTAKCHECGKDKLKDC